MTPSATSEPPVPAPVPGAVPAVPGAAPPAPGRVTIVLPSTGAFDSRTWRIAGSLAARGHGVTVVGRSAPGLPDEELAPIGYRTIRVPASAVDGLPWPLRALAGRSSGPARPRVGDAPGPAADADPASVESARPASGPAGRIRRIAGGLRRLLAIGLTIRSQRRATHGRAPTADLVHAMAYMGIPIGLDLGVRDRAPVVYDARDIYLEARNLARLPGPLRGLLGRVERGWARRADRVVTVNDAYADEMARRFGVARPLVVMNCSVDRVPPERRPRLIHERLGLPADRRIVLYHGGLVRERGIEQLLSAIDAVPDATLVLLGYGDLEPWLKARAADPTTGGRVAVLPAVPPAELVDWVASADVAAMPIQPTTLNHRLTTPNKLFEAIAADVPVVAADLPGMAPIVRSTGCGVVVDPTDPAAIAAGLRAVLDADAAAAAAFRAGLRQARGAYSWEAQMAVLLAEYERLTGRPW